MQLYLSMPCIRFQQRGMPFAYFNRAHEEGTAINHCVLAVCIELGNSNYGILQRRGHFFLRPRVSLTFKKDFKKLGSHLLKINLVSWTCFPSIHLFRPNKVVLDKPHGVVQSETSSYPTWLIA